MEKNATAAGESGRPKIGVQPIVYGRRTMEDLPGVLKEIRQTGYEGFESGNLYTRYSPEQVQALLDENGLSVTGVHSGFGDIADPEKVEGSIQFLKGVGARYLMVSGVGDLKQGLAAYENAVEVFNRVGERCAAEGIDFCYHNHAWEFDPIDGTVPMHYLCEATDPARVKLCIDVYWVHVGGDDPAEFIRRYADRATYFHFKDGWKGTFTELGRGEVNFDRLLPEVLKLQPEWIVYEQDHSEIEPVEALRISREFMRDRLGL